MPAYISVYCLYYCLLGMRGFYRALTRFNYNPLQCFAKVNSCSLQRMWFSYLYEHLFINYFINFMQNEHLFIAEQFYCLDI